MMLVRGPRKLPGKNGEIGAVHCCLYNERSPQVLLRSSDALSLEAGQGERFYSHWRAGSHGTGSQEIVNLKTRTLNLTLLHITHLEKYLRTPKAGA